jgi:hypothetical protein
MLDNMTDLMGERGEPPRRTDENPRWVPTTIRFNESVWTRVGLRFTGHSTLRAAWFQNTDKMPFKLDFDQFEDESPGTTDQRIHGFKQLTLRNNFRDMSAMREALACDLLSEAGLASARTGFFRLTLERGEGPQSLGLYTVREEIEDLIKREFDDASGSLYEADGVGASLAANTQGELEESYHTEGRDWRPIHALYDVLHSEERLQDGPRWRERLESVFDVSSFLKWMAVSTLLEHWDAYGYAPWNYFLYLEPATGRLHWISWDHNFVFGNSGPEPKDWTGRDWSGAVHPNLLFDKSALAAEEWPLIGHLLSEPEYLQKYKSYITELIEGPFEPSRFTAKVDRLAAILHSFVDAEPRTFEAEIEALKVSATNQVTAARSYLIDAS